MADYHAILSDALQASGAQTDAQRRRVYDQARDLLDARLSTATPPPAPAEIRTQRAALARAIEALEREIGAEAGGRPDAMAAGALGGATWRERLPLIGGAVALAAIVAAGLLYWTAGTPSSPASQHGGRAAAAGDDLPPGVDGGSSIPDLPFYLRRQLVYYRTTYPAGSLIAHKSQNYLYLVMPNATARRYSFGMGESCAETAGSRRIAQKEEWPPWAGDALPRGTAAPMAGGPGNPLGARALDLDDGSTRIHGTNAPKTVGSLIARGCIRLINDDVIDLYGRVAVGTRVVITN